MFGESFRNRKKLYEICMPISGDISKAEREFKDIVTDLASGESSREWKRLYQLPGRLLRQAVFMLPIKAVGKRNEEADSNKLIKLAAVSEIIYCAVKLHEEIGSTTVENELAVLMGDRLQALSLLVLSDILPTDLVLKAVQQMEKACYLQIEEEMQSVDFASKDKYFDLIRSKEDVFVGAFRTFAGYLTGAEADEIAIMEKCILNFGVAGKLLDDQKNGALKGHIIDVSSEICALAEETKVALEGLEDGIYKEKLFNLVDYLQSNWENISKS